MKKLLFIIGGGLFLVVVIGFVILAGQDRLRWLLCGDVVASIPEHLVPAAEALLESPLPPPEPVSVYPEPGSELDATNPRVSVTSTYRFDEQDTHAIVHVVEGIAVNGRCLFGGGITGGFTTSGFWQGLSFYLYGLQPGIHHFEMVIDHPNLDEPVTYAWAYTLPAAAESGDAGD